MAATFLHKRCFGGDTIHRKILTREKLANLANHELAIHQNFPHQYSETLKMYLAYALTVAYLPNFSSSSSCQ